MEKALLFIGILASVLLTTSETHAQCTCVPDRVNITAAKEFNLAYAVFVGKVVAIKNSARDEKDRYVETVSFHVTRAWKQDLDSNLTITNRVQGCVNGFEQNEEWLVYAYKNADGKLGAYCCCSRTKSLAKAAEDLKAFPNGEQTKLLAPRTSKP